MRTPISLIAFLAAVLASAAAVASQPAPSSRPNIVLIMSDDLGWKDLSSYGCEDIRTPVLDRLASQGLRFTRFYSNGTECTPTRTALLTGRYQQRVGGLECAIGIGSVGRYDDAIRLAKIEELGLPPAETSIGRMLKSAGYATALVGKWHLGYQEKFSPNRHGFDHALYCIGGGMDYFHHVEDPPAYANALRLNGREIRREGYFTEMIADDAVRWLGEQRSGAGAAPFFLYVPFTSPHSPFQAPDEKSAQPLPKDSPRWNQGKGPPEIYRAMIEKMDASIGRILAALDQRGVAANTLVIFTNDNGGTGSARPFGLRGNKGTTHEGGIRVPCIVRWPGVIPAGREYPHPAASFDLTASIARAAGVKPAAGRPFDGVDILHYAAAGAPPPARDLFWRGRRGNQTWRAARTGDLKYVSRQNGDAVEEWLFDIGRDPAETTNLLAERAADVARLKTKLAAWEKEVQPRR